MKFSVALIQYLLFVLKWSLVDFERTISNEREKLFSQWLKKESFLQLDVYLSFGVFPPRQNVLNAFKRELWMKNSFILSRFSCIHNSFSQLQTISNFFLLFFWRKKIPIYHRTFYRFVSIVSAQIVVQLKLFCDFGVSVCFRLFFFYFVVVETGREKQVLKQWLLNVFLFGQISKKKEYVAATNGVRCGGIVIWCETIKRLPVCESSKKK